MKRYWEPVSSKIDGMSLRERMMIFAAAVFVVIALMNAILLDPLLLKQKALSAQVVQQQEKMKELQAQMQGLLQAMRDDERSPLRNRLAQLRQQLQEQDKYLQSRRDRLVEPGKMAALLEQVLKKDGKLQLIGLKTLPAVFLTPPAAGTAQPAAAANADGMQKQPDMQKQIFKHGVQITVRGGYLDLLEYLATLEKMQAQMFWGDVNLSVEQYPDAVLTLTLYTLSLDKTWMKV